MSQHMLDCNFSNGVFSTLTFGANIAFNYAAGVFGYAALSHAHVPIHYIKYIVPTAIAATHLAVDYFNNEIISDNTLASGLVSGGLKLTVNHNMLAGVPLVATGLAGAAYSAYMNAAQCNQNTYYNSNNQNSCSDDTTSNNSDQCTLGNVGCDAIADSE